MENISYLPARRITRNGWKSKEGEDKDVKDLFHINGDEVLSGKWISEAGNVAGAGK